MTLSIPKQITRLIPPRYRNPFWRRWLQALLAPLAELHEAFLLSRSQDLVYAHTSSLVMSLEYRLRQQIHPDILLVWKRFVPRTWVYKAGAVQRSVMVHRFSRAMDNAYIYPADAFAGGEYHLEIRYPINATIDMAVLRALIEQYLHVGFRYKLVGIIINPIA